MYAGLGLLFFFLVLFLQQVAGYSRSRRARPDPGHARDVPVLHALRCAGGPPGPALLHGRGADGGRRRPAFFLRLDADVDFLTDLLPGLLMFSLGLAMTVAPLTATVLADADEHNAGIASGREQRDRASGEPDGDSRRRRAGGRRRSGRRCDEELGPRLSRPEVARAVEQAQKQPLASVEVRTRHRRCAPRWRRAPRTRRSRRSTWPLGSPPRSWRWAAFSAWWAS